MSASIGTGNPVILNVGEDFHLKRGKDHICYGGMPSADVYSIVQKKANGYQGFAWNLYFPKSRQELTIDSVSVYVENVSPEEIRLRVA